MLDALLASTERAQELIDGVLVYARVGELRRERVALDELVSGRPRYRVAYRGGEHVTDDPTALLHELTATALERGERLEDLSVTRPSLEDVYLELTE